MDIRQRDIAIRALNYLRSIHLPTYIGLRKLLSARAFAPDAAGWEELINFSVATRRKSRFYVYPRPKKLQEGVWQYRDYHVPSPTSALAEAVAVDVIGASMLKHGFVYSYRTINHKRLTNFDHFGVGYQQRNLDVSTALKEGMVAVVSDVESFYPSIDSKLALRRLQKKLASIDVAEKTRYLIWKSALEACDPEGHGLRIGPELSHFLADFAMDEIDRELSRRYDAYFRYVDDIVIVVESSRAETAWEDIRAVVLDHGFRINEDKTAIVGRDEWNGHNWKGRSRPSVGGIDCVSEFKFRAKLFLARQPSAFNELSRALYDAQVFLPVGSLLRASQKRSWRSQIQYLYRRGWDLITRRYAGDSVKDICESARECRRRLEGDASEVASFGLSKKTMMHRWDVQKARYIFNRGMYFFPVEVMDQFLGFLEATPELAETMAVARAIRGDFRAVSMMPGPAAAAASQVCAARGVSVASLISVSSKLSDVRIPQEVLAQFGVRYDIATSVERFASGVTSGASVCRFGCGVPRVDGGGERLDFGDEIESLGSVPNVDDRRRLIEVRMFEEEDVVLDALRLGSAYESG